VGETRTTRYRRSPHLVLFWSGRRLILVNYATRTRLVASPVLCEVLDFLNDWRTAEQLFAFKPRVHPRLLQQLLDALARRSCVQRDDRPPVDGEHAMASWMDWNPAAGFFHNSTKDLRYAGLRAIERMTHARARRSPMPPPVKRYRGAPLVHLPPARTDGEFAGVLLARRTWRRFASKPADLASFSTLLGLTAGVQSWVLGTANQKVALKTSPSGGARQPIELYVLALNVEGLKKGFYHYASDRHLLERIGGRVPARVVERYLPKQRWYKPASAIVFFGAVFSRVQWRYAHARAYRAVLIEAGHVCQTFCLTATWLGLAPFCSMALADSAIEDDLGLDGVRESVMYAAGIGTRPRGVAWIPPDASRGNPSILSAEEERTVPGLIAGPRRR
jgi:SagB-type dehydrogenase family enzyme